MSGRKPNDNEEVIYVKSYRNKYTGKVMIAANYGLKAFRFVVKKRK